MNMSLTVAELKQYLGAQLHNFFPDATPFRGNDVDIALDEALQRLEYCFKHIVFPDYCLNGQAQFSHLHSDQYSAFLYFFANSLWKRSQNKPICDKAITLNKALNGIFFSYKCALPDIFLFSHPVGTVLGNANYNDFLVVLSNVTVNTSKDGKPPTLGKGVFLSAGCSIIGNKTIGDRVSVGPGTLVFDRDIPNDSIVMRSETGAVEVIERRKRCKAQECFNVEL